MKKKTAGIIYGILLFGILATVANAQVSTPNFFKKVGNAILMLQTPWELGSSSARVAKGWFTNLDSTSATIGSLQISSSVTPGPLTVAASSNPDIRFTGDPNTGLSWIDADRMALMTGGTNRLTVNSSGNVGIGTTTPAHNLQIKSSDSTAFSIISKDSTDTIVSLGECSSNSGSVCLKASNVTLARIQAMGDSFVNNNFGIGTGAPEGLLEVKQVTTGLGRVNLSGTSVTGTGTQFLNTFKVGDTITANGETRTIDAIADDEHLTTSTSWTTKTNQVYTLVGGSRMTVLGNGNVGIGTTSPGAKLEVAGTFTVSGSNLTTLGGNLTVSGTSWTATPTISGLITATSGLTANGTLDANAIVTLGDNGENVTIDSNVWDITGAGVASGLTGLASTGTIAFSGAGNFSIDSSAFDVTTAGALSGITTLGMSGQLTSTLATGTSPLNVTSTTVNTNLNADLLDGQHGAYYASATSISGTANLIAKFATTTTVGDSRIFDNGTNIGIGNTNPLTYLNIGNSIYMTALGGNVGIGTMEPSAKLNVVGNVVLQPSSLSIGNIVSGITFRAYQGYESPNDAAIESYIPAGSAGVDFTDLRFYTSNSNPRKSERMRIQPAGNVGIGTTSPEGKLHVQGGSSFFATSDWNTTVDAGGALGITPATNYTAFNHFKVGDTLWGDLALASAGGNVGIGTTSPGSKLDINGTLSFKSAGATSYFGDGLEGGVDLTYATGGLFRMTEISIKGTNDIFFQSVPYTSSGYAFFEGWNSAGAVVGTGGNTAPVIFQINRVEKMRIANTGNVGIGTTSPGQKFTVKVADTEALRIEGSEATDAKIEFSHPGNVNISKTAIISDGISSWKRSDLRFVLNSDANDSAYNIANDTKMIISNGGNVGIGTTSPQQKLEINGGIRLNTATAKPTCAAGIRGTLWYVQGGAGVADTVEACTKDAGDAYGWRALY